MLYVYVINFFVSNLVVQNDVFVQNLNEAEIRTPSYVIFDGSCGFCNTSAMFIAERDISNRFILVSNSSELGKQLLKDFNLEKVSPHSILLIEGERISTKSKAIRIILQEIPGYHFLKLLMKIVPTYFQNLVYDGIAKIRKYLPAKTDCSVPEPKIRKKFRL